MSISTIAAGAALAVAAAVSPTTVIEPTDHTHEPPAAAADTAEAGVAAERIERDVVLAPWGFGFLHTYAPPSTSCPAEAPYLSSTKFNSDKYWQLPTGAELKHRDGNLMVTVPTALTTIGKKTYRTGNAGGLVTNFRADLPLNDNNWVQLVLHCNSWAD